MELSTEQDEALKAVDDWLESGDNQIFRLFGYAGTGKTTIARHFAENVRGDVRFAAYTGKAASVLRKKGMPNASTIHQLIYIPQEKSKARLQDLENQLLHAEAALIRDEEAISVLKLKIDIERSALSRPGFTLNEDSDLREASLVVIDECSMVDGRMADDLLSFDVPVLVLGDPGQLPPVAGTGFFTSARPDFMLQEIHRQARGNPIIELATMVRNGMNPEIGMWGDSEVLPRSEVTPGLVQSMDQVLVGRNVTRRDSNARFRKLSGVEGPQPVIGDKVICLRNNHDLGLLNGVHHKITNILYQDEDRINMEVEELDGTNKQTVVAHMFPFMGIDSKNFTWWDRIEAEEFDYGYAITTHKAQGSQWDDVMVFDEGWVFREDRFKWLYTAITRAAERVKIVRMG